MGTQQKTQAGFEQKVPLFTQQKPICSLCYVCTFNHLIFKIPKAIRRYYGTITCQFFFFFKSKLQNFLEFLISFHAKFRRGKNKGLDNSPLPFLNSYKHLCFKAKTSWSRSALPGAMQAVQPGALCLPLPSQQAPLLPAETPPSLHPCFNASHF